MLRAIFFGLVFVVFATGRAKASRDNDWIITSTDDWKRAERESAGFCFEFRTEDTTKNESKPILDSVRLSFDKNHEVDH